MFVRKKSIPRRTVLRGLGTTLALPLLDAMIPAFTPLVKTAAAPVQRLGVVYLPNGMAMEYWTPKTVGSNFEMSPVLEPLAAFRSHSIVVSGLRAFWSPAHAGASTTFLTGAAGLPGEVAPVAGVSMDQVVAKRTGEFTQLGSLELAIDGRANAGQCSANHSCVYTNTISWRSRTVPLSMENNPRHVFERLFGDSGSTESSVRLASMRREKGLLDSVKEKVADLRREIGAGDRDRMDEYLDGVRDIERRIVKSEEQSEKTLPLLQQPAGIPDSFEEHVRLMFDLQLVAYQTDLTRVISFMLGREVSSRTYPEVGVPEAWHPLSHHEYDPQKIALMARINTFHVKLFSEYVEKLKRTDDGTGSLLDQMTLIYGCGMSDSNAHSPKNVPVLLVGGAGGRLRGGRHLKFDESTPLANLMLTLMDKMDVEVDTFGNSTGRLNLDGDAVV